MKKVIVILLMLQSTIFYAQFRGGNRPQQNQQSQQNRKPVKFDASKAAGIFYYDVDVVIKKIKIKDETLKGSVTNALKKYNSKIRDISFTNSEKFKEIDAIAEAMPKGQGNSSGENSIDRKEVRNNINQLIRPIRNEIRENEVELNKLLETLLSEKENKKWLKYQEKKKKSLQPKRPTRPNMSNSKRRNVNRQRRQ